MRDSPIECAVEATARALWAPRAIGREMRRRSRRMPSQRGATRAPFRAMRAVDGGNVASPSKSRSISVRYKRSRQRQRGAVELARRRCRTPARAGAPRPSAPASECATSAPGAAKPRLARRRRCSAARAARRPSDSQVLRPMTTAWPVVSARKRFRSSGRRQGRRLPAPMTPLRATAAISASRGAALGGGGRGWCIVHAWLAGPYAVAVS